MATYPADICGTPYLVPWIHARTAPEAVCLAALIEQGFKIDELREMYDWQTFAAA